VSGSRKHSPTDDLGDLRIVFSAEPAFSASERGVLAVLILHRNGESGRMDPSLSRIADGAGVGRRTVVRALESLEEQGVLKRRRKRDGRTRTSYSIDLSTRATMALGPESHQGHHGTRVGPPWHQGRATVALERTKRTNEGTNALPEGDADASAPDGEGESVDESKDTTTDGERMATEEVVAAWLDRLSERPPDAAIAKQGAAAKRLASLYPRADLERALDGIGRLFPHSEGEPWDLFDLDRKFTKAHAAPTSTANGSKGGRPVEYDPTDTWGNQ
jgi:DNA-binding MarR family transcriptional regulator